MESKSKFENYLFVYQKWRQKIMIYSLLLFDEDYFKGGITFFIEIKIFSMFNKLIINLINL